MTLSNCSTSSQPLVSAPTLIEMSLSRDLCYRHRLRTTQVLLVRVKYSQTNPILETRNLSLRKDRGVAQDHTAGEGRAWDSNLGLSALLHATHVAGAAQSLGRALSQSLSLIPPLNTRSRALQMGKWSQGKKGTSLPRVHCKRVAEAARLQVS